MLKNCFMLAFSTRSLQATQVVESEMKNKLKRVSALTLTTVTLFIQQQFNIPLVRPS